MKRNIIALNLKNASIHVSGLQSDARPSYDQLLGKETGPCHRLNQN